MKAAIYETTGPAEEVLRITELPDPAPGPGEVLVQIRASGINPADTKRRAGWNGMAMGHAFVIPHTDGAGVIKAAGHGVDPGRIGERVCPATSSSCSRERRRSARLRSPISCASTQASCRLTLS